MEKQLPFHVGRYTIRHAKKTGGKAGKGNNKTSTIQVYFKRYYTVIKSFVYKVDDVFSLMTAVNKAEAFAKTENEKANLPY